VLHKNGTVMKTLQVRDELVMVAAAIRGASMVDCSGSF